jgi:hypothetical protein
LAHQQLSPHRKLRNTGFIAEAGLPPPMMPPATKILLRAAAAALLLNASAIAEETTTAKEPRAPFAGSIRDFGDYDKVCSEWTDGCRGCRRIDATTIDCSNIGIACQPKAIQCTAPASTAPR